MTFIRLFFVFQQTLEISEWLESGRGFSLSAWRCPATMCGLFNIPRVLIVMTIDT